MIKKDSRIIAWDDCSFKRSQNSVLVIGPIFRGGQFMDGLVSTRVLKDGMDATISMAEATTKSRHYDQLSYVMLNGITYAGFNIVDIKKLNMITKLPVIAVQRKLPEMKNFNKAIESLSSSKERSNAMKNAGKFYSSDSVTFQKAGISDQEAKELLELTSTRSNVPEPLRIAHLIASGLSRKSGTFFESRGRA